MNIETFAQAILVVAVFLLAAAFLVWLVSLAIDEMCATEQTREKRRKRDVDDLLKRHNKDVARRARL